MIREYRLKKNLTQEQLAEKLDISSRHLQRLEYEEDRTTVKTLKKIINVLDIPNDEFLKYIGKNLLKILKKIFSFFELNIQIFLFVFLMKNIFHLHMISSYILLYQMLHFRLYIFHLHLLIAPLL